MPLFLLFKIEAKTMVNPNFANFAENNTTSIAGGATPAPQGQEGARVRDPELLYEWGKKAEPEGNRKVLIIRTTLSGKNVNPPTNHDGGKLTTLWPGLLLWSRKGTNYPRLFATVTILPALREEDGQYVVDKDLNLYAFRPDQFGLDMHVLTKYEDHRAKALVEEMAKSGNPSELLKAAEMLKGIGVKKAKVRPSRFLHHATAGGDPVPAKALVNFPGRGEAHQDMLRAVLELSQGAENGEPCPGILEVHMPFERLSTYSYEEDLKYKDPAGNTHTQLDEDKKPRKQVVFKWGNRECPITYVSIRKGSLPGQVDDSKMFSLSYTDKAVKDMTKEETPESLKRRDEEQDLTLWKQQRMKSLRDSSGNKWHWQAKAYPAKGQDTCEMWEDWGNEAKRELWKLMLNQLLDAEPGKEKKQPHFTPAVQGLPKGKLTVEGVQTLIRAAEEKNLQPQPFKSESEESSQPPTPQGEEQTKEEGPPESKAETPEPTKAETPPPQQQEAEEAEEAETMDEWDSAEEASSDELDEWLHHI